MYDFYGLDFYDFNGLDFYDFYRLDFYDFYGLDFYDFNGLDFYDFYGLDFYDFYELDFYDFYGSKWREQTQARTMNELNFVFFNRPGATRVFFSKMIALTPGAHPTAFKFTTTTQVILILKENIFFKRTRLLVVL
jgi:hypothetical protein